jgi:hypothetical protein
MEMDEWKKSLILESFVLFHTFCELLIVVLFVFGAFWSAAA